MKLPDLLTDRLADVLPKFDTVLDKDKLSVTANDNDGVHDNVGVRERERLDVLETNILDNVTDCEWLRCGERECVEENVRDPDRTFESDTEPLNVRDADLGVERELVWLMLTVVVLLRGNERDALSVSVRERLLKDDREKVFVALVDLLRNCEIDCDMDSDSDVVLLGENVMLASFVIDFDAVALTLDDQLTRGDGDTDDDRLPDRVRLLALVELRVADTERIRDFDDDDETVAVFEALRT